MSKQYTNKQSFRGNEIENGRKGLLFIMKEINIFAVMHTFLPSPQLMYIKKKVCSYVAKFIPSLILSSIFYSLIQHSMEISVINIGLSNKVYQNFIFAYSFKFYPKIIYKDELSYQMKFGKIWYLLLKY